MFFFFNGGRFVALALRIVAPVVAMFEANLSLRLNAFVC